MEEIDDINPFADEPSQSTTLNANGTGDSTPISSPVLVDNPHQEQPPPTPPAKNILENQSPQHRPPPKTDFCCTRDRWLHSSEDTEIQIIDAQKTSEGSNASYITYVIRTGTVEARRRYSEFESLRNALVKLYPTLIVPPIPSKTSLGDYAAKQGKAKEDLAMIARRKRLLYSFLNRVARHPILSNEHVFHRFLQSDVSWSEVLLSPPISQLPKNMLRAPANTPTDTSQAQIYAALPSPSATQSLRHPDQRFLDSEAFTDKFASHMGGPMEKVTRRLMKRWSEYAQDHADLGAALNAFSLHEQGPLALSLEKTGQAIDATYLGTATMLQEIEASFAEPLHEYTQFSEIIRKLLTYRHQRHLQYEMTQTLIETKKEQLQDLERVEQEAQRLNEALSSGRPIPPSAVGGSRNNLVNGEERREREREESEGDISEPNSPSAESSSYAGDQSPKSLGANSNRLADSTDDLPPYAPLPLKSNRRRAPGMGLISALGYSIQGMMDVDPEAARRSNISKTRETISQLQEAVVLSTQDLKYASATIQADLDRFQRQKVADLRDMAIAFAMSHREFLKSTLAAWEDVKKEATTIPPHPNDVLAGNETVEAGSSQAPNPHPAR